MDVIPAERAVDLQPDEQADEECEDDPNCAGGCGYDDVGGWEGEVEGGHEVRAGRSSACECCLFTASLV